MGTAEVQRIRLLAVSIVLVALAGVGALVVTPETSAQGFTLDGKACEQIATPVALPVGLGVASGCTGVRPGAALVGGAGACTFNFMWKGSDGDTYMGTAGHCALEEGDPPERKWTEGSGPAVADGQGNRVGEFAYAVVDDPRDFALVRLDEGVAANPQMCHFGGPTGINNDLPGAVAPTVLQHYGQGQGLGSLLPARTHVALGMPDPDHVFAAGVVLPGDSGSGVTTPDGRAVGVVVTLGVHTGSVGLSGIDAGTVGVTRLAPQIARAQRATGVTYTLQTAPAL